LHIPGEFSVDRQSAAQRIRPDYFVCVVACGDHGLSYIITKLSGSWPGELFLFRGGPDHSFAPPEMLRDKDGNIINIGGGITEDRDGYTLIRGNAKFERMDEGTFVNYHGTLDLLVGDYAHQKPDRPEATPQEAAEHERIRKELEPLRRRFAELFQKMRGDSRPRTKEEQKKLGDEFKEISTQMSALRSNLPREYESHGWVWLFLRK